MATWIYRFTRKVPVSVSDDGKLITIDLRGMVNSVYRLTNGYSFTDDTVTQPRVPPISASRLPASKIHQATT